MSSLIIGREIDDLTIRQLRSYPDAEAAVTLDAMLRTLERQSKRSFISRGLILVEADERKSWEQLIDADTGEYYTSMTQWVTKASPFSYSDCMAAKSAVRALKELPMDELLDVPRCNLNVLIGISSGVRQQPEIIRAAQTMTKKAFIKQVNGDYNQHYEDTSPIYLNPVESAKTVIEEAVAMACFLEDLNTKEQVIEYWAAEYLEDHREIYEELRRRA